MQTKRTRNDAPACGACEDLGLVRVPILIAVNGRAVCEAFCHCEIGQRTAEAMGAAELKTYVEIEP